MELKLSEILLLTTQVGLIFFAFLAVLFYRKQAKVALKDHLSAVYRFVFEIMDAREVRTARHHVYEMKPEEANREHWLSGEYSPDDKKSADAAARSFDRLGFLIREGVVPVNILARFDASPALRCWHNLQPFVGVERETRRPPQEGHLWEWENLVFRVIIPHVQSGKGIWAGVSKHDRLEGLCSDILAQEANHKIPKDEDYHPPARFWVVKPRYERMWNRSSAW